MAMHLQQTKRESLRSGGPQYYLHELTPPVKEYLRAKGIARVALVTPYGATLSSYVALSKDRKLNAQKKPVLGKVGHARIQQGGAGESMGEAIRKWYGLPSGNFERIDVDIDIRDDDEAFYVAPTLCKYAASRKAERIAKPERPLTFTVNYRSDLWMSQLRKMMLKDGPLVWWSIEEIRRIARDHQKGTKLAHIQETDILRASGPLKHLGMTLGGFRGKGIDCKTDFQFLGHPSYNVPVELKRDSSGFRYQLQKYGKDELSRAVILCATHSERQNIPPHIDIIELAALAEIGPMDLRPTK
jgi:hypothetical protein